MSEQMKIGNSVKININNREKIWVEITSINGGECRGKIDEHPIRLKEVFFGDEVSFKEENICGYLED